MSIQKIIYLIVSIFVGFIFYTLQIPAGWLIGSLLTGIVYGIFIQRFEFEDTTFKIVLAFIGTNIGLLLMVDTLKIIHHLLLPLLLTIVITITAGFLFSIILHKKAKGVNKITAFFCCIPGGASEIIGISGEYGADDRLVAAFHTVRITVFTATIPLIVSLLHPIPAVSKATQISFYVDIKQVSFVIIVISLAFLLTIFIKIPGGPLLFSILISFVLSEFVFELRDFHPYLTGIGQALIGSFVGIRFDKSVLVRLLKVGPVVVMIISMFFILTLLTTTIFMLLTGQPFATSLIGTVPAGAAEMSVTAVALDVNPTIVSSLHMIRVLILFLSLPLLLAIFSKLNQGKG